MLCSYCDTGDDESYPTRILNYQRSCFRVQISELLKTLALNREVMVHNLITTSGYETDATQQETLTLNTRGLAILRSFDDKTPVYFSRKCYIGDFNFGRWS